MQVYDVRKLINGEKRKITFPEAIQSVFLEFKKLDENLTEQDLFYAGYILSNPVVREQFMKDKKEKKPLRCKEGLI